MGASRGSGDHRRTTRLRGHRGALLGVIALVVAGVAVIAILVVGRPAVPGRPADAIPAAALSSPVRTAAAASFAITAYQGQATLGGSEIDFSSLLGRGRPVILNFWAGLCPPCRAEMPGFQSVYAELSQHFVLVGVDVGPFIGLGSR